MNDLLLRLQELNRKVGRLEKQLESLHEERHDLEQKLENSEKALLQATKNYEEMVERYEAVKLSKALVNPEAKLTIQEKIDWYLKEIDICLNNFGD
ncbi:MAG: hypothetical protein AAFY71_17720 [Bacteroidota bacterium]